MAQEPSAIRDEIAETGAELAETVHALAEKADVKARLKDKLAENTAQLQAQASELGDRIRQITPERAKSVLPKWLQRARTNRWLLPAAFAFAAGLLLGRRLSQNR